MNEVSSWSPIRGVGPVLAALVLTAVFGAPDSLAQGSEPTPVRWTHLSSANGDLPLQTLAIGSLPAGEPDGGPKAPLPRPEHPAPR